MKTILPLKKTAAAALLTGAFVTSAFFANAQSGQSVPELSFKNPVLESGVAGNNGAVYRFSNIGSNLDALVTIAGRSSSQVRLTTIDLANTGYDNAFQPQISYNNGSASRNQNWWMEFSISLVNRGTTSVATVNAFNVTALDLDGDNNRLYEYASFYNFHSYTVERNSVLVVRNLLDLISGVLTPGKQFDGTTADYSGVNVDATNVMTTLSYRNMNTFRMRAGAATGNASSSSTNRMYSFWFKSVDYNIPVQVTLPVKLSSFTATLHDDKADLKWTSSYEKDVSHFSIEKSLDGEHFSQAAYVFAIGNSSETNHYSFTDKDISTAKPGIIYYRLRSVDIDGKSELSVVRMITTGNQNRQALAVVAYPNPVTSELRITIPYAWQGKKVTYELVGNNGQAARRIVAGSATQTETINVGALAPGFYIVTASCNGEMAQQKIIKR